MDQFADMVGAIQVTGQIVRIELMSVDSRAKPADGKQPPMTSSGLIIMPLDGFVRSFGAMNEMMQKLVEAGVVKPPRKMGSLDVPDAGALKIDGAGTQDENDKVFKAAKKARH